MPSAILEYYKKGIEKRKRLLVKFSLKIEKIEELLRMNNFFTNEEEYMLIKKMDRIKLEMNEIKAEIKNIKRLIQEIDSSNTLNY